MKNKSKYFRITSNGNVNRSHFRHMDYWTGELMDWCKSKSYTKISFTGKDKSKKKREFFQTPSKGLLNPVKLVRQFFWY